MIQNRINMNVSYFRSWFLIQFTLWLWNLPPIALSMIASGPMVRTISRQSVRLSVGLLWREIAFLLPSEIARGGGSGHSISCQHTGRGKPANILFLPKPLRSRFRFPQVRFASQSPTNSCQHLMIPFTVRVWWSIPRYHAPLLFGRIGVSPPFGWLGVKRSQPLETPLVLSLHNS